MIVYETKHGVCSAGSVDCLPAVYRPPFILSMCPAFADLFRLQSSRTHGVIANNCFHVTVCVRIQAAACTPALSTLDNPVHKTSVRKVCELSTYSPFAISSTQLDKSESVMITYTPKCQGRPAVPSLESLCIMELFCSPRWRTFSGWD